MNRTHLLWGPRIMISEIESYFLFKSFVRASWTDADFRRVASYLKPNIGYIRRKLVDPGPNSIQLLMTAIFELSLEPSASKLAYVSGPKTLGQILKRAIGRLNQAEARRRAEEDRITFNSELLDKIPAEPAAEPEVYPIATVQNFRCSVKRFAKLIGTRYASALELARQGRLVQSGGAVRALDSFRLLCIPTPLLDSSDSL